VIEPAAEPAHLPVEFFFTRMRERRMPDIVNQREGFGQIFVESENTRDRSRDLRDFDGVGEAISKVIVESGREDLGLVFESPERAGMHDPVAIPLKIVSVGMR
jgi:hypothetical protein